MDIWDLESEVNCRLRINTTLLKSSCKQLYSVVKIYLGLLFSEFKSSTAESNFVRHHFCPLST